MNSRRNLDRLFRPRSILIVGASTKKGRVGYELLKNLIENGYDGEIYGLNPKGGELNGVKFFKSIDEVPMGIDLVLFATPGEISLNVLEELVVKDIGSAIIYASGFAESGGEELQRRLQKIILEYGIRVIGPNCAGIINHGANLYASFVPSVKDGFLAMTSQSGAFSAVVNNYLSVKGLGLRALATLGNKVDVDEADFLEYFRGDVKGFILYIEGLKPGSGIKLIKTIRDISKPVVILKGGRYSESYRALYSHTASLGGEYKIFKDILHRYGGYMAYDYIELVDIAEATSILPKPKGEDIAMVTNGGGPGVVALDHLNSLGISIPPTPKKIYEKLGFLKSYMNRFNPIDLTADGNEGYYYHVLETLLRSDWPDIIYTIHVPPSFIDPYRVVEAIGEAYLNNDKAKPVIPLIMGVDIGKASKILRRYDLPLLTTHRSGAQAIDYMIHLYRLDKKGR